jgi:hypothetical protein
MDITNFFKTLGERLSSPLFYSFITAWLVINWEIPIGICLYNSTTIQSIGYPSFFDFITKNLDTAHAFVKPAIAAILYTFGYPFLKNCIQAFNTWIRTRGTNWNLKIAKEGVVSVEKYIQLREIYKSRSDLLQRVLETESESLKELEQIRNKKLLLEEERIKVVTELNKWKSMTDITELEGEWELQYTNKDNSPIYRMRIRHNILEYIDTPPHGVNSQIQIKQYFRHPDMSFLTFTTYKQENDRISSYHFSDLTYLMI